MGKKGGVIANKKEQVNNSPTSATKSATEENGPAGGATSNTLGNLKSFEHLIESLILTQTQCRDEQAQQFVQLQNQLKNYHQEKANACDCVNVPWSDLHLMKISRDESNPVQRIIEMFANFQICQREQKEAQNELEAFRKAMNFVQSKSDKQERIINQKNTEIERLKQQQTDDNAKLSELKGKFDSQKHLIIQKDEEIELLKQQKSDDATKLAELNIKIEENEMTIRETNDLLAQTRLIAEEHRDEVQIFQSQISAMSGNFVKLQSECEKQELLIEQKDEEIELLKQRQTDSTTMLNELNIKMEEKEATLKKINDLLSVTRQFSSKYRNENQNLHSQISALKSDFENMHREKEATKPPIVKKSGPVMEYCKEKEFFPTPPMPPQIHRPVPLNALQPHASHLPVSPRPTPLHALNQRPKPNTKNQLSTNRYRS